jgi:hypothetical protein
MGLINNTPKNALKALTLKAAGDASFRQEAFSTLALAASGAVTPDTGLIELKNKLKKLVSFCIDC